MKLTFNKKTAPEKTGSTPAKSDDTPAATKGGKGKKTKEETASMSESSVEGLLARFKKDLGDEIGSFGGSLVQSMRLPTGLFELDLAIGGGFPRGKCSIIYGPESSTKTTVALLAIAINQIVYPDEINVFVDVEHEFNREWAKKLGVDVDKLVVLQPDYAEQAVDMIESFLLADNCGIVVLDSIAALVGTAELNKSAEDAIVGGVSLLMGKLYRRTVAALRQAEKAGRYPSLFYINQVTTKIGVQFGDPETTSGGKKPGFQSALTLRVYGKSEFDKKISEVMPVAKLVSFVVKKFKVPIMAASGKYVMVTVAHKGLKVGQSDDAATIRDYLIEFGEWEKEKKGGYTVLGEFFATQKAFGEKYYGDAKYGQKLRKHVMEKIKANSELMEPAGDGSVPEGAL